MKKGARIGVMAPYLDGEYFGKIIEMVHKVVQEHGGQMFVYQTIIEHRPDYPMNDPVSLDFMDGWMLILDSPTDTVLEYLKQSAKPIVAIGYCETRIPCHTVMIDNRSGTRQAVLHLIEHGHRDIAFVGQLRQYELQERFEGYKEALAQCAIPFREELVINTDDNIAQGGAYAAQELLSRRCEFSAVALGADLNAIGMADAFREMGHPIPAFIGFDNSDQAENYAIPITTIEQKFDALARKSTEILFQMIDGDQPAGSYTNLPTEMIVRASCGCSYTSPVPAVNIEALHKTIAEQQASLNRMSINNFQLVRGLVHATSSDKIHFSNLFWNDCHWGCLALWEDDGAGKRELVIHQVFGRPHDTVPPIGARYDIRSFPPVEFVPDSSLGGGPDYVIMHPVVSETHDWGYLALVGPPSKLNRLSAADIARNSYTILSAALERESLFNQIRSIAEQLEIVSRTTNDGIWDWNLLTNKMEWNDRIYKMLDDGNVQLTDDPDSLFRHVHPDDFEMLEEAFERHIEANEPFHIEFRLHIQEDSYMWLFVAGEVIRDQNGKAVRMIGSVTDITKKKADEEKITQLAYHDALTGLPNRLLFQKRLELCMAQSNRYKFKLAVLLIDLDRFKYINDTLGHQAGDKLLQHVAQKLSGSVRECDTIARLGGDEFIILLTHLRSQDDMKQVTDRIVNSLTESFFLEDQEIRITGSIGASIYPDHADHADTLIKYADIAMYKAKENGRNQLEVYTEDMSSSAVKRFNLEKNLRKAIDREEFILHYQPQVDLQTGSIMGAEVLIRWLSPEKGLVPPMDFIPLAEEMGLIVPIGTWVLRQACLHAKQWLIRGNPPMLISVNISAHQFHSDDFAKLVRSILEETGIPAQSLCLEITESTAIRNIEHSVSMLNELVDLGVQVAIDDFGTGYSSLGLLKRLPIHMVKIDKSFIRDMTRNSNDEAIVKAIVEMSHCLGFTVTAEGVEIAEQVRSLNTLNCDFIQGYYVGKPMFFEAFTAFYEADKRRAEAEDGK